ncbi:MAG: hypothetical protein Q9219_005314 [cf. Caloplaca sp. 3 TL-2023]
MTDFQTSQHAPHILCDDDEDAVMPTSVNDVTSSQHAITSSATPKSLPFRGSDPSDPQSEWVMIPPNSSTFPTTSSSTADSGDPSQHSQSHRSELATSRQSTKRKSGDSPDLSDQVVASSNTNPFTSRGALQKHLLDQSLHFYLKTDGEAREKSFEASDIGSDAEDSTHTDAMASNQEKILEELNTNFMFIDKRYIDEPENAKFKEQVIKVVKADRKSTVSQEERENFKMDYQMYSGKDEATLTWMMVPYMMERQFTAQDLDEQGNPTGDFQVRVFSARGVEVSVNRLFAEHRLPHALMDYDNVDPSIIKSHFQSSNALTTPKPDFAYGIAKTFLPPPPNKISDETLALLNVTPVRDVFLDWENKSGGGDMMKCRNQALKGTAQAILAQRQLLARMGQVSLPGIDEETYLYAAANNNDTLQIFVAYAWVAADCVRTEFCMDRIATIPFSILEISNDENTLANLRKPLHNIMEWGCMTRMPVLKARYEKLWTFERKELARIMAEKAAEAEPEEGQGTSGKKRKTG